MFIKKNIEQRPLIIFPIINSKKDSLESGYHIILYDPNKNEEQILQEKDSGSISDIAIKDKSVYYTMFNAESQKDEENDVYENFRTTLYSFNIVNGNHTKIIERPYKVSSISVWEDKIIYIRSGNISQVVLYDVRSNKRKVLHQVKRKLTSTFLSSGCLINNNFYFLNTRKKTNNDDTSNYLQKVYSINLETNKRTMKLGIQGNFIKQIINYNQELGVLKYLKGVKSFLYEYKEKTYYSKEIPYYKEIHSLVIHEKKYYFVATYKKWFKNYSSGLFTYDPSKRKLEILYTHQDPIYVFDIVK